MTEKKLVPELRFPEFEGEWVEKKLGNVSSKVGSGSTPKGGINVYTETGIPFIRSQNVVGDQLKLDEVHIPESIHTKMKGSTVFPDDILLNITGGSIGRSCVVPADFKEGNVNQHVSIIRLREYNSQFVQLILSSFRGQKLVFQSMTGSGREGLNFQSIRAFKISFPALPEQQKIASFLTAIDSRIQALEKKKSLLEQYKKGVMQGLFRRNHDSKDVHDDHDFTNSKNQGHQDNQEKSRFRQLRFKDENGQDFPAWEFKNGNTLFKSISDKDHNSDLPILAITQDKGAIPRDQINYSIGVTAKSVSSYKVVQIGDFIISLRSFQGGIEYSNFKGICSPAYIILRAHKEMDRSFYKYYLKTPAYIQELTRKLEGIRDGKMISYKYFSEIKLPYPSLPEQTHIANFLTALDKKIEGVDQQIEKTKRYKKGLLQKMFV